jgi:hypothetical protein
MKSFTIILLVTIVLLTVYLVSATKREGLEPAPSVIPIVDRAVQIVSSNSSTLAPSVTSSTPSSVVTQQSSAAVTQVKQMIQANSSAISSAFDPSTGRLKEEAILPIKFFHRLDLPWEAAFLAGKCFLTLSGLKTLRFFNQ